MATIDAAAAAELATNGVVTVTQLVDAGLCIRWAARQARRGKWQCPARGTYVVHPDPLTDLTWAQVGAAYAGPDAVLTGLIPLRMMGLRWLPAVVDVHALVPDPVRIASSKRVIITRTKDLHELRTWERAGIRLAPIPRAVIDAARHIEQLRDVRGVVLGAVADRHAEPEELRLILNAGQRNGSALTRRAIRDAARGCASPPEAELVDALIGCGQPFLVNPEVWCDDQLVGCPDVLLVGCAVTGEVESIERHDLEDDRERTYDRHERFVARGFDPVHLSVRRIRGDVRAAAAYLLERARQGAGFPVGLTIVPRGPVLR